MSAQLKPVKKISDDRGHLCVLEEGRDVPFPIKRVYYMYGASPDTPRGFHAHKKLRQLAVCITGSCRMVLDDGKNRQDILMNETSGTVMIGPMMWREMHDFSHDCVLLVLASDVYDEADYIRDYEQFKREIKNG
jgi:dTDP-4-dehydrorhamnose 3,5-epimerase-like enzyme